MIEFRNISMLPYLLAFILPVIIHFFIRSRAKFRPFAAIFLLKQTIGKRNSRIRFSQLLLLLLRIAIVLLLGLSMMKPVLKKDVKFLPSLSRKETDFAMIIDTSLSMNRRINDRTVFDHLKKSVLQFLSLLTYRDRVTVFLTGQYQSIMGKPFDFFSSSLRNSILSNIRAGYGRGDLLSLYRRAESLLQKGSQKERAIVVFSDFQNNEAEGLIGYLSGLKEKIPTLLVSLSELQEKHPIVNAYVKSGGNHFSSLYDRDGNRMICRVGISSLVSWTGGIEFESAGKTLEKENLNLAPQNDIRKEFLVNPKKESIVEVKITGDDFNQDNHFFMSVGKQKEVKTLLVTRDKNSPSTKNLLLALDPYGSASGNSRRTVFNISVAEVEGDEPEQELKDFDWVLVPEIGSFPISFLLSLESFVEEGGKTFVAFGENDSLGLLNEASRGREEEKKLIPSDLEWVKLSEEEAKKKIVLAAKGKREFNIINESKYWDKIRVTKKVACQPNALPPEAILINGSDGQPLLMMSHFGEGAFTVFFSSLDGFSNSLVKDGVFLPMLHQCYYLMRNYSKDIPYYFINDEVIVLHSGQGLFCLAPSGEKVALLSHKKERYFIAKLPGVYRIFDKKGLVKEIPVNVDWKEGVFKYFSLKDSEENNLYLDLDRSVMADFISRQSKDVALWRIFLWFVLFLLVLEMIIVWRIRH